MKTKILKDFFWKTFLLISFLGVEYGVKAQGATLTKEETVNYINKKLAESNEHKKTVSDGKITATINWQTIEMSNNGIITRAISRSTKLENLDCPDVNLFDEDKFNVSHIVTIELAKNYNENEAVGTLKIKLLPKTGHSSGKFSAYSRVLMGRCVDREERSIYDLTVDEISIYYLKGDPTNFKKIKKAFEYLRDLNKAEDDPFGD
ncbi:MULTISPECIES: hypothetical protein [Chryseobacterium]|uniref:hypothetical protein n=1 Tax=Chryseobacterium TaxID=59732 RepID=UPI001295F8AC|nr:MULTISPECIES: hypothetical protein [Chryseobacterium]MDR6921879.1 hypothetical protein [Chryseobacterium sp. 2987]